MSFLPDENSRASRLFDYVREYMVEDGTTITYAELADMFGMDELTLRDHRVSSDVVAKVNTRLHRDGDHRHLISISNVGYRIATPQEARGEVLSRTRAIDRQQVSVLRTIEKIVRHPNASMAERTRAANAAQQQANLLSMTRREHRKMRAAWKPEETSPVPPESSSGF
jgi:hypothetical protein